MRNGIESVGGVAELCEILAEKRRELVSGLTAKIRQERDEASRYLGIRDVAEISDDDIQSDIRLGLAVLQSRDVQAIDAALRRLEAGTYGYCADCEEEIASQRLRAVPFAIRCKDCEEADEVRRPKVLRPLGGSLPCGGVEETDLF